MSDPNTLELEIKHQFNKALMTILNRGSFWRVGLPFGDDALEQVSHLLAKPEQTDIADFQLLSQRMDKSMISVRFKTIIPGQSKNIIEN